MVVSQVLLQPSGSHSRNHHAKCHKSGTDGIVCRLVFAVGKVNEVEHVGCESETVSELFDEDANVDKQQGIRLCIAEVYINKSQQYAPAEKPRFYRKISPMGYSI